MTSATLSQPVSRSARLSAATDALHEHLHTLVAAAAAFDDRERFARFALVQYQFQREVDPLYRRASLQALLPNLDARRRLPSLTADLSDLGVLPPNSTTVDLADVANDHTALGWLFVSEGSTLGAAVLLKRAQALGLSETFGARYLAAAPEGRGRHWKQFIEVLDTLELTADQDVDVIAGAMAAFRRFAELITREFAL